MNSKPHKTKKSDYTTVIRLKIKKNLSVKVLYLFTVRFSVAITLSPIKNEISYVPLINPFKWRDVASITGIDGITCPLFEFIRIDVISVSTHDNVAKPGFNSSTITDTFLGSFGSSLCAKDTDEKEKSNAMQAILIKVWLIIS